MYCTFMYFVAKNSSPSAPDHSIFKDFCSNNFVALYSAYIPKCIPLFSEAVKSRGEIVENGQPVERGAIAN